MKEKVPVVGEVMQHCLQDVAVEQTLVDQVGKDLLVGSDVVK